MKTERLRDRIIFSRYLDLSTERLIRAALRYRKAILRNAPEREINRARNMLLATISGLPSGALRKFKAWQKSF